MSEYGDEYDWAITESHAYVAYLRDLICQAHERQARIPYFWLGSEAESLTFRPE